MNNKLFYKISAFILVIVFTPLFFGQAFALTPPSSYNAKATMFSRVDLRKYFEKAMSLFENGKYKEAIAVFENLIEIEKSQNESYFTPFAEIYIDKSRARISEMFVVEDRKWARMKQDVIDEAEKIARQEAEENARKAREEEDCVKREEELKRKSLKEARRKKELESEENIKATYERALGYYSEQNYPAAIVEFKKVKELAPENRLTGQADSFIEKAQGEIKEREERELLVRMEAASAAKMELERENRRLALKEAEKQRKKERMERQKAKMRNIFEARLKDRIARERIVKIDRLMNSLRKQAEENKFEEAEALLAQAMEEFPENERFKDIAHYIDLQKLRIEEKALKRAREITEEKMLLEIAKQHLMPEVRTGTLKNDKKITPIVKVPEIRKRLKIPISVDFKDIELDYVLAFLSDATGVNIVTSSEIDMAEKKVTMKIKDMPLEEALRYILKAQDLIYRIEEDAVWVATKEELDNENIETRVYFLNQGIGRFAEFSGVYNEQGQGSSEPTEVKTLKEILENSVDWPKDSKLTVDDRTGALIVNNIPSNLEIIENLLYNLDVTPTQVLIEARFLEVIVNDTDELGFEWKLNSDWGVKQNNDKQNIHGFSKDSGVGFSDFSANKDYGFNLTYQGILSHPQFQAVLHAFQSKQNVKTLSSPRITTLNNQTATIEVVDEYIYPTRYEVSLVQYDINGDGDFDDAGETEWANIPQDFVTRDIGILLHVKPSVGVNNKTVTLALTPEVSEYAGKDPYLNEMPQFTTRNLSTSIIVESGETIVMGGLIKEVKTNTKTKVPLLGDLPIIGGLFKKNEDGVERKNLLIFVTATVLNKEENIIASAQEEQLIREQ